MREIPLKHGKVALVDDEDYSLLSCWTWMAYKGYNTWYAKRETPRPERKTIAMHVHIMKPPKGMRVDHIDGNGLNNQRHNLRVCTNAQNIQNSRKSKANVTGYRGVCWNKEVKKYHAQLTFNYERIHIGYFSDPAEAAHAYDKVAKERFGEFAVLNFPD